MDYIWLEPVYMVEGSSRAWQIYFEGASAISSPGAEVYDEVNGDDLASTYMPAGSHSTNGVDTVTLKPLVTAAGQGGTDLVVVVHATIDGSTDYRKFMVHVVNKKKAF